MSYFLSLLNEAAVYGSLAALQALLLNRLGLAFAAIPAFVGLGAYALAARVLGGFASAQFVVIAVGLAGAIGVLYLCYHGRVSPSIFSLESALLVLAFTVMASRWPELAALAALLYGVLPYFLTKVFPLSQQGAADVIRICWGGLLITAVLLPHMLRNRQRQPTGGVVQ